MKTQAFRLVYYELNCLRKKILNKLILSSVCINCSICAYSQNSVALQIDYFQIYNYAPEKNLDTVRFSMYCSDTVAIITKIVNTGFTKKETHSTSSGLSQTFSVQSDQKEYIIKNFSTLLIHSSESVFSKSFDVSDSLIRPEWQISKDKKIILNYPCQKAIATVRGREYEAWFTDEIPLTSGPWKLWGLPGLILEAKSTDGEVIFKINSISMKAKLNYVDIRSELDLQRLNYSEYCKRFLSKKIQLMNYAKSHPDVELTIDVKSIESIPEK